MSVISNWTEATYRRMTLMQRMIERLNVDTTKVVSDNFGMTFRTIVGRCRGCRDDDACTRWLDGKETKSDPSSFCPNEKTFRLYRVN